MSKQDTTAPTRKSTKSISLCSPQMIEALAQINLLAFAAEDNHGASD